MNTFMENYFGPLGQEWCIYFYLLSVFFGLTFVFSAISILSFAIMNVNKVNTMFVVNSGLLLLNTFLAYLVNRLLNTMCVVTL
jgi:hypothetical protein